jgi:hypothetical protein
MEKNRYPLNMQITRGFVFFVIENEGTGYPGVANDEVVRKKSGHSGEYKKSGP